MAKNKYGRLRETTGLNTYQFAQMLFKRDVCDMKTWYNIENGKSNPQQKVEDGVITLVAELTKQPFNDVLLELRGQAV
jgi:DNA-binding XRE family transcriptional regulator